MKKKRTDLKVPPPSEVKEKKNQINIEDANNPYNRKLIEGLIQKIAT